MRGWIRSAWPWRISTPWGVGGRAASPVHASTSSAMLPDGTTFDGIPGLRHVLLQQSGSVRHHPGGKAARVRRRPGARLLRFAGDSRDHARRGPERIPFLVDRPRHRQEHAVSDEEIGVMIITKMALPRRTFLRGVGRHAGAAVAGCDGPGAVRYRRRPPPSRSARLGFIYMPERRRSRPTVDADAARARTSSSRRS